MGSALRLALAALLLLLAVSPVVIGAAQSTTFPLDMKLTADRITDAKGLPQAVGKATITNKSNKPLGVDKVVFDIRFMETSCDCHKDDIRQQYVLTECSGRKLPLTLQPGKQLVCPFKSVVNIYGGKISVVAGSMKAKSEPYSGDWTSFDIITSVSKAPWQLPTKTFKPVTNANIPGNDISCGQKDWDGSIAVFCKICGGKDAVQGACKKNKDCVAFDMEAKTNCGYLKASQGPMLKPAPGFTSWLSV